MYWVTKLTTRRPMAGRRLLDVIALYKASRGIASSHISLRSHQLDTFSKTSSLAKAVQSQTDRVTLTLKALSVLNDRLNGPLPSQYSTTANNPNDRRERESIPRRDSVGGEGQARNQTQGLEQDHFYKRSEENTITQPVPEGDLKATQKTAKAGTLPDGSIPVESIPSKDSVDGTHDLPSRKQGLEQDHFYQRSQENTTTQSVPNSDLTPKQEVAKGTALPDGSIYVADSKITAHEWTGHDVSGSTPVTDASERTRLLQHQAEQQIPSQSAEAPNAGEWKIPPSGSGPVLSSLPRTKIPKATEDAQGSSKGFKNTINQDVFYTPGSDRSDEVLPDSDKTAQPSEETYAQLFHSPRAAKLLKGKPDASKAQVTTNVQAMIEGQGKSTATPASSGDSEKDVYSLAADIAKELRTEPEQHSSEGEPVGHLEYSVRPPTDQLTDSP